MTSRPRLVGSLVALLALISPALQGQTPLVRPQVGPYFDHLLPEQTPTPPDIVGWSTLPAFPNLTFINPVGILPIPGTTKLVVWEREGRVWAFDNDPATATKTLVLDLSTQCQGWDDSGLLSLVFHPDFVHNRQVFVWYTWRGGIAGAAGDMGPIIGSPTTRPPTSTPNRDRLSRFALDENFQASLAGEFIMLDQKANSVWHNGCGMFFHPETGFLYLSDGDDSSSGGADNSGNPQFITKNLFSCVMRIDVDKRGGAISHPPVTRGTADVTPNWPAYYIPNDNPFVGLANAREEIIALGLRNPFRMSCDAPTGRIYIGDVGSNVAEEVNIIEPGDKGAINFQWSVQEGRSLSSPTTNLGVLRNPVIYYNHGGDDGSCVIGGYVYRGTAFPELYGKYIFGDVMSGRIWYLDESVTPAKKTLIAVLPEGPGPISGSGYRGLSSFGLDASGELFVCRMSSTAGAIYKLQRGGPAPGPALPPTLSATGFFSDLATLTPSSRLTPYDINVPFWSDGAVKKRFAAIPSGTTIGFQPTGEWDIPGGSVFVKHFDLPVSDIDPAKRRRLETRVLVVKEDHTVYGGTYRWREDQSDADLLDSARNESIPVEAAPFGPVTGQDMGSPSAPGSTIVSGNQVSVTSGRGYLTLAYDSAQFAHQTVNGDFDVAVQVTSLSQTLTTRFSPLAGLMVRESLDPDACSILLLAQQPRSTSQSGYSLLVRQTPGAPAQAFNFSSSLPKIFAPQTWLRLKRSGNAFTAFVSSDGMNWVQGGGIVTLEMNRQVKLGLTCNTLETGGSMAQATFLTGVRNQLWSFPGRQDCVTCHTPQAGGVLGLNTRQMNLATFISGIEAGNQLSNWNHAGFFHDGPADADLPGMQKLVRADDVSASLELRVRSYLDANCANCHRPGGAQANWDARIGTPLDQQGIVYGALQNTRGKPDARVVTPQSLPNSMLHTLVNMTGPGQMPPVARNTIDQEGVTLLTEWIASLTPSPVTPPANLTASVSSKTALGLSWTYDSPGSLPDFIVEASSDGTHFEPVGTVPYYYRSYEVSGLPPFSHRFYRVAARIGDQVSPYSNVVEAFTDVGDPEPEISVSDDRGEIANLDFNAADRDSTCFALPASSSSVSHTLQVKNAGNLPLHLKGTPRVRISGPDAAFFTAILSPDTGTVEPGQSLDLILTYTSSQDGVHDALVSISSDDSDEADTTFAITGERLPADLAGWWKFDETAGNIAADASGHGLSGTVGAAQGAWTASGISGGALAFTGIPGDGLRVASAPELDAAAGLTVSLWAKSGTWENGRCLFTKGAYSLWVEGGKLACKQGQITLVTAPLPERKVWTHLAVVFDSSRITVYSGGTVAGSADHEFSASDAAGDFTLGAPSFDAPAASHFNGWLDEVRFYSAALDERRIGILSGLNVEITLTTEWQQLQKSANYASETAVRVYRSGDTRNYIGVDLSLSGTAVQGSDYALSIEPPLWMASSDFDTFSISAVTSDEVTGSRELILSVKDGPGYHAGSPSIARIGILDTPYHEWKIATFGSLDQARAPGAADNADPDHDGMDNLTEAALGGNPLASDSGKLPRMEFEFIDGSLYPVMTYTRPYSVPEGVSYTHLWAIDDLTAWETAYFDVPGYPLDNGDGTETVKVYTGQPVEAFPSQFLKLQIDGQ